jgi:UDP-N-acetylmuramoyl-L-alanyl-D-glutamate--2,6-diaminopimelate ligase
MLDSRSARAPDDTSGGFLVAGPDRSSVSGNPSRDHVRQAPVADLVASLPRAEVAGDRAVEVIDVVANSAEVRPGALFFCVPGEHRDGHDFAGEAVRRGAVALVTQRRLDVGPPVQVMVPSVRAAMGPVSSAFFGHPSEQLTLVGVTGTNGKTTSTYLLESIFRAAGRTSGVIGTTGVRIADGHVPFARTTPEAPDLQRLLRRMVDAGVDAAAMEVSSHGLDQGRVDGTRFACSIFTNLSRDHLDYHRTLEAYFEAKARLFTPELSIQGAVNRDSTEGRLVADRSAIPITTFGLEAMSTISGRQDMPATNVEVSASGCSFEIGGRRFRSPLRGTFNVYNCLGVVVAARLVGVEDDAIAVGLESLHGVPGRLEPVDVGQSFTVLVDYAHTPDSLENVLSSVRSMTSGRLILVFGCGGDRDRGKRPVMGETATRGADLSIVTSDNPRSEDPLAIIAEIEAGARRGGGPYEIEADRRAAIRAAVGMARAGDVVLIAGKGHEAGQEFADRTVPFDDREVAADELRRVPLEGSP